jgi:hypothetical protein
LLLLFFSLKISAIFGDAFILPRSLDGASTTREYLILSFSRFFPPFCLRESTAEREREREILISVSWCQEYTAYYLWRLSSSSLSLSFGKRQQQRQASIGLLETCALQIKDMYWSLSLTRHEG